MAQPESVSEHAPPSRPKERTAIQSLADSLLTGANRALQATRDFLENLSGRSGSELKDIDTLLRWIASEADGDLLVMAEVRDAVDQMRWVDGGATDPDAAQLVIALLLTAAEHYVQRRVAVDPDADALAGMMVQLDEPLAAAIVAGCLYRGGVRIVRSADGVYPVPLNVIQGLAPVEFGYRSERDLALAEIDAALAVTRSGAHSADRRSQHKRQLRGRLREEAAIKIDLKQYRKHWGVSLMFGFSAGELPAALQDPALRADLAREFGVQSFVFRVSKEDGGCGSFARASVDDWERFGTTLIQGVNEVIAKLYAAKETHNHSGAPLVFVSYAHHEDDAALVGKAMTVLEALHKQGRIDLWVDKHIGAGKDFEHEIKTKIDSAQLAVLLISNPFLVSDFLRTKELPWIRERQAAGRLTVCGLILRQCMVHTDPLLERVHWPLGTTALNELGDGDKDALLKKFGDVVLAECARPAETRRAEATPLPQ